MQAHDVSAEFQGGFRERRAATRFIVIHHAAALYPQRQPLDDIRAIHRYHLSKGWSGIGYHVVLAEDTPGGAVGIYQVSDLRAIRAHVYGRNTEAVGICCATNFGAAIPAERWLAPLAEAVAWLHAEFPGAAVVGHREIALPGYATTCPGARWAAWQPELVRRVQALSIRPTAIPILGPPSLPQDRAVQAITSRLTTPYTAGDVRSVIVPAYYQQAQAVGVDPVVALAQMVHETDYLTSWWADRPRRNPAGIGVTGETAAAPPPERQHEFQYDARFGIWRAGLAFATWAQHAIPVHIGRLLAYALPPGAGTAAQQACIARALALRPLADRLRGSAPTLDGLAGTWAAGPGYAAAIRAILQRWGAA